MTPVLETIEKVYGKDTRNSFEIPWEINQKRLCPYGDKLCKDHENCVNIGNIIDCLNKKLDEL